MDQVPRSETEESSFLQSGVTRSREAGRRRRAGIDARTRRWNSGDIGSFNSCHRAGCHWFARRSAGTGCNTSADCGSARRDQARTHPLQRRASLRSAGRSQAALGAR